MVAANLAATMLGYMTGTISSWSGYFYVLKYVEYFVIYYMAVNNLRDREHAWRLVTAAFITAAIVSVIGLAQVPSGERVSAPFEGETGEPNTFGGDLLFIMAIAPRGAPRTQKPRRRLPRPPPPGPLARAAFITAAIVSVIGLAQVPSGERVSAPFEGETGEPNTFGGYLLFMMAIAAGVALETQNLRRRVQCLALLGLMAVPFFFTLSRASYLGLIPACFVIARYTTRRRFVVGLILFGVVLSPALLFVAPKAVKERVTYTFKEERGSDTVRVGKVAFDPSTSARLMSFKAAFEGFAQRPVFGWGVTGFGFMDAQYARVLAETGLVGLVAFVWLMWAVGRHALGVYATRGDPEERGLVLGFLAGFAGLLIHGFGSNTFIIVRIMEPFWLITGIVMMIPALEAKERAAATAAAAQKAAAAAPKKERAGARP